MDRIHTLIVGAGPSGLAAGNRLAQAGCRPLVVESSDDVGGLMRSVKHGPFRFDLGRKELYTRIPEVDELWRRLLGADYRLYEHRVGSLYKGRIVELSGRYKGQWRGLPVPWLVRGCAGLFSSWLRAQFSIPNNYEDYWHNRAGPYFSRVFAQGYWEKFRGQSWSDMPAPAAEPKDAGHSSYAFKAIRHGLSLAAKGGPVDQQEWRHPAKGTSQICEALAACVVEFGGTIEFGEHLTAIRPDDDGGYEVAIRGPNGAARRLRAGHLVSSMPIEALCNLLWPDSETPAGAAAELPERAVLLVYLIINDRPRFPHAWLEVNDTALKAGRITNYAAFAGDMVPDGWTGLCVEFFCHDNDPLLKEDPSTVAALAAAECAQNGLIDRDRVHDSIVMRLPRTNAAASWREWQSERRLSALEKIRPLRQLYHVNRPGTDWATFAGLLAAEAIISGDRETFDRNVDPTRQLASAQ